MVSGGVYEVEGVISRASQGRFSMGQTVYFDLPDTSQKINSLPVVGEHVVIVGKVFQDGKRARIANAFYSKGNTSRPAREIAPPPNP